MKLISILALALAVESCVQIGNTIVYNCGSTTDSLQIKSFQLDPPTLVKGKGNSMTITGEVKGKIDNNVKIDLIVKMDGKKVYETKKGVCQYMKVDNNKGCPFEDGQFTLKQKLNLAKYLREGNYTVDFLGSDKEKKQVAYLQLRFELLKK